MANSITHAALPYPIKNARYTVEVPYLDADGDPTDPTTPDTEVSQDGGAFADAAEEVTTITGSNGAGYITLTGAETNNSSVVIAFKVASGPKNTIGIFKPRVLAIVGSGTLSAGSAGGGTLGTVLAYDVTGCFIRTTGGTGGGGTGGANNQARKIITYTTSTGAFTVAPNWETTPSTDTTYDVLLPEGVTLGMLRTLNPATPGRTAVVDASGLIDANTVKVGPTGAGTAQTAGDIQAALTTIDDFLDTEIAAIKAKTDNLPTDPADQSAVEAAITAATSPLATAANLATVAEYLDTEIQAILADTNELQTDLADGGRLDLILDDILARAAIIQGAVVVYSGAVVDAAAAADSFKTDLTQASDWWADKVILFTSGNLQYQSRVCSTYTLTDGVLTFDEPFTAAPTNGSNFYILAVHAHTVSQIQSGLATQTSVNDLPTNAELATAITLGLTTALTEGYRATGATGSVRDLLYEVLQSITEFTISGTTKTVKKLDGSTTAKTYTLNDGTTPTGITEAT